MERILVYAAPKAGKTRLVTSLPWGEEPWGERAVYIAADPGAARLRGIPPENVAKLLVVDPRTEGGRKYDPIVAAAALASRQWPDDVGTIIWDTMSQTALDLLSAYAMQQRFPNESVTLGTPGTASHHVLPARGDYHAVNISVSQHILRFLFDQPKNLIVVCHEEWDKADEGQETVGGPVLAGKGSVRLLAGKFDSVLRLTTKRGPKKTDYIVRTQPHGAWKCGVRTITPLVDEYVLSDNPADFWRMYYAAVGGQK